MRSAGTATTAQQSKIESAYFRWTANPCCTNAQRYALWRTATMNAAIISRSARSSGGRQTGAALKLGYAQWRNAADQQATSRSMASLGWTATLLRTGTCVALCGTALTSMATGLKARTSGGQQTCSAKTAPPQWRSRYDERGKRDRDHLTSEWTASPACMRTSAARWRNRYDERSNEIERAFLGMDDKPAPHRTVMLWLSRYDPRAGYGSSRLSSAQTTSLPYWDGYARWRSRYDPRAAMRIGRAFFRVDDRPIPHEDGYALWRSRYRRTQQ